MAKKNKPSEGTDAPEDAAEKQAVRLFVIGKDCTIGNKHFVPGDTISEDAPEVLTLRSKGCLR